MLTSCTPTVKDSKKQYTASFLNYFDTLTTVVGYAESEDAFQEKITPVKNELEFYHKLFDIYNSYDGIINLKTLNDTAAISPVKVDPIIIEFLGDCKSCCEQTGNLFNPAMGAVLSLWHDARKNSLNDPANAYLPDENALAFASLHTDCNSLVIDCEKSTVYFSDPYLKLDVGAVAKGWAVEKICSSAPDNLLISVGGNVYATGAKDQNNTPWAVGIQNPFSESGYLHILNITKGSVVTSGSYHRAYTVNGKLYHHIIDPKTLYPSELWTSVTVVCDDSGIADVLSTALFIVGRDEGQKLLDKFSAKAMWVDKEGNKYYSTDFKSLIRN